MSDFQVVELSDAGTANLKTILSIYYHWGILISDVIELVGTFKLDIR